MLTITRMLGQQSYILQISLVVVMTCALATLLYHLALALPSIFYEITHAQNIQKTQSFQQAQRMLIKQMGTTQTNAKRVTVRKRLHN